MARPPPSPPSRPQPQVVAATAAAGVTAAGAAAPRLPPPPSPPSRVPELASAWAWANDIKLGWDWQQPEDDPGQRGQAGGVAGFAVLVPAAGPLGLALVAAAGPPGDEVAVEGDLEGEVGSEVAEVLRGKSIRSR